MARTRRSHCGCTLTNELSQVARLLGLSLADLATLQHRAARAAFAEDTVRAALVADIDAWLRSAMYTQDNRVSS